MRPSRYVEVKRTNSGIRVEIWHGLNCKRVHPTDESWERLRWVLNKHASEILELNDNALTQEWYFPARE